ncbi:MAG: TorF family putative porin [Thiotrichales bacterium]|nr:TorF family putative porin [Thiotrichales bacterium]
MMNRLTSFFVAGTLAMVTTGVSAGDSPHEFSANIALTTDYLYRGISQTSEEPAIQGGFDYSYSPWGFYAGVWASNLDFEDGDTSIEIDYYGGFAGEFANGISWDIGGLYYQYPGTDADAGADFDFVEAYGSLGYTFSDVVFEPTFGVGVAWSPDFFGEDDDGIYVNGTLDLSLPHDFGLSFLVGHQDVDGDKTTGPAGFDYTHYVVGVNKSWKIFDFDVSYYDTSDETDCGGDICEALVFTISSSF